MDALRYGVCVGSMDRFVRIARPSLQRLGALERTTLRTAQGSIFEAYNSIIDEVASQPDVKGLVLMHEDFDIRDEAFESKVSDLLDQGVAIVGTVGGREPVGVRWDEAGELFGRQPDTHCPNDFGGGTHDVDMVDGCLMVLSPWAIGHLRFDPALGDWHGYDADLCMQARRAGKRVVVADLDTFHHTKGGFGHMPSHQRTDDRFRSKWGLTPAPLRVRIRRSYPRLWRVVLLPVVAVRSVRRSDG